MGGQRRVALVASEAGRPYLRHRFCDSAPLTPLLATTTMHVWEWLDEYLLPVAGILFFVTAVGAPLVVRRLFPQDREGEGDVLGAASGIVGVVNAVLLAFIVFAAWSNYDRAAEAVNKETDAISLPTPGTSFHIFRNKDLYLIILCRLPQMPERHMKVARFVLSALSIRRD